MIASVPTQPVFQPGQLVRHRRYGYRGVVVAFDPACLAPDEWYQSNQTQPDRQQPWYHVLVDGARTATYSAQENLEADPEPRPVRHPLVEQFFSSFAQGMYERNERQWPGWEDGEV